MIFIFTPTNEETFKYQAFGNTIETVVTHRDTNKEICRFTRRVRKQWTQTCKNNIETDHRIKSLKSDVEEDRYMVYTHIL